MRTIIDIAIGLVAFASVTCALNAIELDGQDFKDTVTGDRFQVIGIAYQPGGSAGYNPALGFDPLSNATACLRDVAIMQLLGVNTIRSYNLDPDLNHDECASILNLAGIYMLIDVNSPLPGGSINDMAPASSYDLNYINRTFAIVDAFKDYPNTLGFFAANELVYSVASGATNPPYIRAVQRDIKSYIASQSSRSIPVGYSAADNRPILPDLSAYLECKIDSNDNSRSDFIGLNSYSWCGNATFESSGYNDLVSIFAGASSPTFFSEFGCNKVEPRPFTEIPVLYSKEMIVFSGGVVYEYSEETNDYGLVQINTDGTANLLQDFNTLQNQLNSLDFALIESHNSTASSISPPTCSKSLISKTYGFSTNFSLPKAPSGTANLIQNGVPNSNKGKIINISNLTVPVAVYGTDGNRMQNLAVTPVSNGQGNMPSATAASPSATSSGAASRNAVGAGMIGLSLAMLWPIW